MQLQVSQPNLSQMFGQDSLYNTLYGMQQQDQATAVQQQNIGQAQQDQQFQAENQPYNLQQAQANIAHTQAMTDNANAQTPGFAADSTLRTNAVNADSSVPASIRNNKALNDYLAKASASDLEQHANKAQSDLYSDDPTVAANARAVLTNMPAIQARLMEIRAQGANEASVAGIHGQSAVDVAHINADGRFNLLNAKADLMPNTSNYAAMDNWLTRKAMAARAAGDDTGADYYTQQAAVARQKDAEDKAAAAATANTSKIALTPATGMPTNAPPQVTGGVTPTTAPPVGTPVAGGMVPMRDKTGVPHMVPRNNVQKALQAGWSQ